MLPTVKTGLYPLLTLLALNTLVLRPATAAVDETRYASSFAVLPPGLIPDKQVLLPGGPQPQEHEFVRSLVEMGVDTG